MSKQIKILPAFPQHGWAASEETNRRMQEEGKVGMSLRDYFAAKAMQGIVSSIDGEDNYRRLRGHAAAAELSVSEWIARDAYKQADAMLKAREVSTRDQS